MTAAESPWTMPNPKARAVSVEAEAAEEDLVAVDSVAADLVVAAVAEEVAVEDLVVAAVAAEVAVEDLADAAVAGEAAVEDLEVRQFYGCNVVLFIKKKYLSDTYVLYFRGKRWRWIWSQTPREENQV